MILVSNKTLNEWECLLLDIFGEYFGAWNYVSMSLRSKVSIAPRLCVCKTKAPKLQEVDNDGKFVPQTYGAFLLHPAEFWTHCSWVTDWPFSSHSFTAQPPPSPNSSIWWLQPYYWLQWTGLRLFKYNNSKLKDCFKCYGVVLNWWILHNGGVASRNVGAAYIRSLFVAFSG